VFYYKGASFEGLTLSIPAVNNYQVKYDIMLNRNSIIIALESKSSIYREPFFIIINGQNTKLANKKYCMNTL
jgi:hypothetical protein